MTSLTVLSSGHGADVQARGGLAYALLCIAALVSTWGAVTGVGLVQATDALLLASVVALVAAGAPLGVGLLPKWVIYPIFIILLLAVVHQIFPVATGYLDVRLVSKPLVDPTLVTARIVLAGAVLPWLVVQLCYGHGRDPRRILNWWVLGSCISGGIAFLDLLKVTDISGYFGQSDTLSGREAGLATHVNNLGVGCAVAFPLALYLAREKPALGYGAASVLIAGAFSSGSRGAQLGILLSVLIVGLIARAPGRRVILGLTSIMLLFFGAIIAIPGSLEKLRFDATLRFVGSVTADSDSGRALLAEQALNDFRARPMNGVGFEVLGHAHNVYLQLLSAGGIVLLVSFVSLIGLALRSGTIAARAGSPLAPYLVASVITWMLLWLVENQVTDRYLYYPWAVLVSIGVMLARQSVGSRNGRLAASSVAPGQPRFRPRRVGS